MGKGRLKLSTKTLLPSFEMDVNQLVKLHKNYIQGTGEKGIVEEKTIVVAVLARKIQKTGLFSSTKVHLNTRVLKHLYDRKPAEEYDFLIKNLPKILQVPDRIYKNRNSKRGDLCLVKEIAGIKYLCSLENSEEIIFVVTAFRVRKESYLKNYKLVWSWKDGTPSS